MCRKGRRGIVGGGRGRTKGEKGAGRAFAYRKRRAGKKGVSLGAEKKRNEEVVPSRRPKQET